MIFITCVTALPFTIPTALRNWVTSRQRRAQNALPYLDIPYPTFCNRFDFGHSSVTVIRFNDDGAYTYPKVLQLSNDSLLYKENKLTGYYNEIDI